MNSYNRLSAMQSSLLYRISAALVSGFWSASHDLRATMLDRPLEHSVVHWQPRNRPKSLRPLE